MQIRAIGEREGVHQKIDLFEPFPRGGEEFLDLIVIADVDGMQPFIGKSSFGHGFANAPLGFLRIVHGQKSESAFGALPNGMLGDMRRDAAIVGDVED